jgi:hypothetical protein
MFIFLALLFGNHDSGSSDSSSSRQFGHSLGLDNNLVSAIAVIVATVAAAAMIMEATIVVAAITGVTAIAAAAMMVADEGANLKRVH